jgi:phosphoribosylpyrophosphate synthetase
MVFERVRQWFSDEEMAEQDEQLLPVSDDEDYSEGLADAEQYFNIHEERESDEYWGEVARAGYALAKQQLDNAYRNEDVSENEGLQYLRGLAEPALRKYQDLDDGPEEIDLPHWAEQAQDDHGERMVAGPGFHKDVDDSDVASFYDEIAETYEPDEFDTIVGVHSSGLPFLTVADTYFDADNVILRYSHMRCSDDEVKVGDVMDERMDVDASDVLIVDDIVASGETLEEVGSFLYDRGASDVQAIEGSGNPYTVEIDTETGETEAINQDPVIDRDIET